MAHVQDSTLVNFQLDKAGCHSIPPEMPRRPIEDALITRIKSDGLPYGTADGLNKHSTINLSPAHSATLLRRCVLPRRLCPCRTDAHCSRPIMSDGVRRSMTAARPGPILTDS